MVHQVPHFRMKTSTFASFAFLVCNMYNLELYTFNRNTNNATIVCK
jgi:hypothetical protein